MKRRIVFTAFSLLLALSMSLLYSFVALSYGLQNLESPVNINFERENKISNSIKLNVSCDGSSSLDRYTKVYNSSEIYGDTVLTFVSSSDTVTLTIKIGIGERTFDDFIFAGVLKLNGLVSNMKVVSSDKGTIINTVDSIEMSDEIKLFSVVASGPKPAGIATSTLTFSLADTSNFNYELNGELIFSSH